jgi:hypothetical protein
MERLQRMVANNEASKEGMTSTDANIVEEV